MSPSMETVAAGLAGFAFASLLSFARKPQVVRQDAQPTSRLPTGGNSDSYLPQNTPTFSLPGMGHDFHMLARLVAEKQRSVNLLPPASRAEESMRETLKSFHPQLAEFSSFEWRADLTGQNLFNVSEMVGRNTHVTFATNSQSQGQHLTKRSHTTPPWSQSKEHYFEPVTRDHEASRTRSIESIPDEYTDRQRDQQSRKCCRRGDYSRRRGWGWCRARDDDTKLTGRGWSGPRGDDDDDRWGWSRYREERYT